MLKQVQHDIFLDMNNPKLSFIAAISRTDRGMGYRGKIQWHISSDWKRFKEITKQHVIIMGRKTLESLPKPLPDRVNIVVTRETSYERDGVIVTHSIDKAIEKAKEILKQVPVGAGSKQDDKIKTDEIFIIGGGELFTQAISLADKLYLTLVDGDYPADTFFPDYSQFTKVVYDKKEESDGYSYEYMDLER